ncbi:MAG TPA: hypothetical protein VFT60_09840 [Bryobacteraceae bacterium]|jgi:hypothetical protein|nr:hypothetical protein [Bryobacteraceae bacterium]
MKSEVMRRALFGFFLFLLPLAAANVKLYTTDGSYQLVREYQVNGDRVRYYSADRNEWEEIPTSLVDLKKTEKEAGARQADLDRRAREFDAEEQAARAERAELEKIPQDSGVYQIENGVVRTFPVADITVHTSKGRSILKVLTPAPIIPGKATVELSGEHSANVVRETRPEFYFRLDKEESFGLVQLTPHKGIRQIEEVEIMPASNENVETRTLVPTFTRQLPGDNFYKVWPQEPLKPGEYAWINYIDGKVDLRAWDFRID